MTVTPHRTELAKDGYERIEARIQEIERLAYDGMFSERNTVSSFQKIVSEAKNLRQTLREVFIYVPPSAGNNGKGDAA
jgi:signal transduction histidine kinase